MYRLRVAVKLASHSQVDNLVFFQSPCPLLLCSPFPLSLLLILLGRSISYFLPFNLILLSSFPFPLLNLLFVVFFSFLPPPPNFLFFYSSNISQFAPTQYNKIVGAKSCFVPFLCDVRRFFFFLYDLVHFV